MEESRVMIVLQAALNGSRSHPTAPRSPSAIAQDAKRAVAAGAHSVHVHAFDAAGAETLDGDACAGVLRAIRSACPDLPVSLTTSAAIEPDVTRRLAAVQAWHTLPDLVTANQGEAGIVEMCEWLMNRGVGIEAGLLSAADARTFAQWPGRHRCVQVLIEPLDPEPERAVAHAAEMERIVRDAGVLLEQVHHGDGVAAWSVNARALARGHGIRTGLEDTAVLPDGSPAESNEQLVRIAAHMLATSGRAS